MILWICLAILTAVVVGAIMAPLSRDGGRATPDDAGESDEADLAVYRDQLTEIETDRERGLIDTVSADAARAELARRIFSSTRSGTEPQSAQDNSSTDTSTVHAPDDPKPWSTHLAPTQLAYVLAASLPLISVAFYLAVGSPGVPGRPHIASVAKNPERTDVEKLIEQVEARLRDKPQDGLGWDVVAPIYLGLERFEDAKVAYRQAALILGPTKKRLAGLGLSAVRASGGTVTDEARDAFKRQLTLDPGNIEARLWLARANEQDGDRLTAIKAYKAVLKDLAENAPWRPVVQNRIAQLQRAGDSASSSPPKPEAGAPTGAPGSKEFANMSDEQRSQFITQMVERLAMRVASDGSNFDDWIKLVRAYAVLGRKGDAKKGLKDARARFGSDENKSRTLDALEQQYQLGS